MPIRLKINPLAPFKNCNFCCCPKCACPNLRAVDWIICIYCTLGFGYLVTNIVINAMTRNEDPISQCEEEVLTYSWASLLNILLLVGQAVFIVIGIDTRGRFNDCKDKGSDDCGCCCCCSYLTCAILVWIGMFGMSLGLGIPGSILFKDHWDCLLDNAIALFVLIWISQVIQYCSALISLCGILIRSGIIEIEEAHPNEKSNITDDITPV